MADNEMGLELVPLPGHDQEGQPQEPEVEIIPPWVPELCMPVLYLFVYLVPMIVLILPYGACLQMWPTIEPHARNVCRWLVKNGEYIRKLLRSFSFMSLVYAMHMAWYLLFTKTIHHSSMFWIEVRCKTLAILSAGFLIVLGYVLIGLFRQFTRYMANNHDGWEHVPDIMINTVHFVCATGFALASMYFGTLIKDNKIENQMWCALLVFVLLMSMSLWTVDDFGAADSIIAIIIGFIYSLEKGKKNVGIHLLLASGIPALRYYIIPLGNAIVRWVKPPDDAPVEEATCAPFFTAREMKIVITVALVAAYLPIPIAKTAQLDNYYIRH